MNAINLKDILTIKIKSRHDSYSDQFNRIFMVKMFLLASVLIGIDYFHDSMSCIAPIKTNQMDSNFVQSACWIAGLYIYPDLTAHTNKVGYYGIPKNLNHDGINNNEQLCSMSDNEGNKNRFCKPLTKLYFLQYQWYPFYIGSLAVLHYLPYILFRMTNTDLISLRNSIKDDVPAEDIVMTYFNHKINPVSVQKARTIFNIIVKCCYIATNILSFYLMDTSLSGNFVYYGTRWLQWSRFNNSIAHDLQQSRLPRPGDILLPSMGICEIHEGSRDIRHSVSNKHKFVCEISSNVLYQYVLIVLWWLMIFAIIISVSGLLATFFGYVKVRRCFCFKGKDALGVYNLLTLRECSYLEFIRSKEMPLYAEILRRIYLRKHGHIMNLHDVITKYEDAPSKQNTLPHPQNQHTHGNGFI